MIATILLILSVLMLIVCFGALMARQFTSLIILSALNIVFCSAWAYIKENNLTDHDIMQGFNAWFDGIPLIVVMIIAFIVLIIGASSGLDNALSRLRKGDR